MSFAALVYEDPSDVVLDYQVGFDAGDRMRGFNLLGTDSINWSPQRVNIFRIDGEFTQLQHSYQSGNAWRNERRRGREGGSGRWGGGQGSGPSPI